MYFFFENNSLKTSQNSNIQERENQPNSISYGIYENDKILNSGSTINTNKIKHKFELNQKLEFSSEYMIFVFNDFQQKKFSVGGKIYDNYILDLDKTDSKSFELEYNVDEKSKELCYLVVKKPKYIIKEGEINRTNILQEVICLRYHLAGAKKIVEYEDCKILTGDPLTEIFLCNSPKKLNILYNSMEREKKSLVVGNVRKERIDYAIISLLNWKQSSFNDGKIVKYISVNPKEKAVLEIDLPEVEKNSVIQYIAFPYAFNVTRDNYYGQNAFGSFRLNVKNKE